MKSRFSLVLTLFFGGCLPALAGSFVNFETPHVHPLELTPNRTRLLAVNTPDSRLEVFDVRGAAPVSIGSVPVGLDPVTVRARNDNEAWVINHVSDSISVVDLNTLHTVRTLQTGNEPADLVFVEAEGRAFVSCSERNVVQVFNLTDLDEAPITISIDGEEPRAMAVSPDGQLVYVGIFESGNRSTILGSHASGTPVNEPDNPYGGQSPPPNSGTEFEPPVNPQLPAAPQLGLIVRQASDGNWYDDNSSDWTEWVSGVSAFRSGRITGWELVDNDIAVINSSTLEVEYYTDMMNIVMAIAVLPSGRVTAVGTDAINEVRFEPNLNGQFVRVNLALGNAEQKSQPRVVDINSHLDYSADQIAQQNNPETFDATLNNFSVGDPRGIVWNGSGTTGYVTGMGSNNLILVDRRGNRIGSPIPVGRGPTGVVLDERGGKLYVLNKFGSSVSVVNLVTLRETRRVAFFDPTPSVIRDGREFLYNTHFSSGLGHLSCASCHVDARMDRLAWDLGNPSGELTPNGNNCGYGLEGEGDCQDYHPMKAAMLTQTLQDIIGHEPFHWRGDKTGLEEFNAAFVNLQGAQRELTPSEMQRFEDFLATIHFPPNPYRNLDNSLPEALALPGHYAFGSAGGLPRGAALPPGNAQAGLDAYRFVPMHQSGPGGGPGRDLVTCVMCHTLPTGMGGDVQYDGTDRARFPNGQGSYIEIQPGPDGQRHLMITGLPFGGAGERHTFKVPQLRNLYERVGFQSTQTKNLSGFGFFHDGSNTLTDFLTRFPGIQGDQMVADMIAFLLAFSGSDLPMGSLDNLREPPGTSSQDVPAAVGQQVTFFGANNTDASLLDRVALLQSLADAGRIGLVAKGSRGGITRGYYYVGGGNVQADDIADPPFALVELINGSGVGKELTITAVPVGSAVRIGVDRDDDGIFDANE